MSIRCLIGRRLKLILIRAHGRLAAHALQLALHILRDMVVVLVDDALCPGCIRRKGRLEVAAVADGATRRRATHAGSTAAAAAPAPDGAMEAVVEVVRCCGEG